jgi:hypothetical protein
MVNTANKLTVSNKIYEHFRWFLQTLQLICWNINKSTLLTLYIYIYFIYIKKSEFSTLYLQLLI